MFTIFWEISYVHFIVLDEYVTVVKVNYTGTYSSTCRKEHC